MKMALLVRSLHTGGAERQVVELADAMVKRGHSATIFTFYGGGEMLDDAVARNINVVNLDRRAWWDFFLFLPRLAKETNNIAADVLYSFCEMPNLAAVLIRRFIRPCKVGWGIRNSMTFNSPAWFVWSVNRCLAYLSGLVDFIIANSDGGRLAAMKVGFEPTNCYVVSNAIDTSRFYPSDELRAKYRESIGIASREIVIGNVGIRARKGTADFLRAAAIAYDKHDNLRFLIVGDNAAESIEIANWIQSLGLRNCVICLDATKEIVAVYNAMDILCSASHGEGFPNVIAEAMSCGKPCVVTDVGESAQIVGPHGVVVPPKSPEVLADGILTVLADRTQFGDSTEIRSRIDKYYSSESAAKKVEDIVLKVCKCCQKNPIRG